MPAKRRPSPRKPKAARKAPARRAKAVKRASRPVKAAKAPKKAARKAAKAARPAKTTRKAAKVAKKAAARRPAKPAPKAAAKRAPKEPLVEFTETPHATRPLRIALFGAGGRIGRRIADEAIRRGHQVTALVRNPDHVSVNNPNLRAVRGDVTDPLQVEVVARNHDVVVSAIAPPANDPEVLVEAAQALLEGARATGKRVVVVGGAGSLEVAPGQQLIDSPAFPADWRPVAAAHRDALKVFRAAGGDGWTVVSPSALIEPGQRTGRFRLGDDALLKDKKGDSRISMEDFAVAVVDELESGRSPGKRITVGY